MFIIKHHFICLVQYELMRAVGADLREHHRNWIWEWYIQILAGILLISLRHRDETPYQRIYVREMDNIRCFKANLRTHLIQSLTCPWTVDCIVISMTVMCRSPSPTMSGSWRLQKKLWAERRKSQRGAPRPSRPNNRCHCQTHVIAHMDAHLPAHSVMHTPECNTLASYSRSSTLPPFPPCNRQFRP